MDSRAGGRSWGHHLSPCPNHTPSESNRVAMLRSKPSDFALAPVLTSSETPSSPSAHHHGLKKGAERWAGAIPFPPPSTIPNPPPSHLPWTMAKMRGSKKRANAITPPKSKAQKRGLENWADPSAPLFFLQEPSLHKLMCYLNPARPISLI